MALAASASSCTLTETSEEAMRRIKFHAQRKFAQGMTAPSISNKDAVKSNDISTASDASSISSPIKDDVEPPQVLPIKRPNTEDFLTFLCFRRTSLLPPSLDFFNTACFYDDDPPAKTENKNSSQNCQSKNSMSSSHVARKSNTDRDKVKLKNKKPIGKIKGKSIESRKLAQKVKAKRLKAANANVRLKKWMMRKEKKMKETSKKGLKNVVKTQKNSPTQKKQTARSPDLNRGKEEMIKKQRIMNKKGTNPSSPLQKKRLSLRQGLRSSGDFNAKTESLSQKRKSNKALFPNKRTLSTRNINDKIKTLSSKSIKKRNLPSEDAPPVKKSRLKESTSTSGEVKRSKATLQQTYSRPSRRTKEAAALFMEMLGKDFCCPNQSKKKVDDDAISVESFPELPSAKKNEQIEREIKEQAKHLSPALKNHSKKTQASPNQDKKNRGNVSRLSAASRSKTLNRKSVINKKSNKLVKVIKQQKPLGAKNKELVRKMIMKRKTRSQTKKTNNIPKKIRSKMHAASLNTTVCDASKLEPNKKNEKKMMPLLTWHETFLKSVAETVKGGRRSKSRISETENSGLLSAGTDTEVKNIEKSTKESTSKILSNDCEKSRLPPVLKSKNVASPDKVNKSDPPKSEYCIKDSEKEHSLDRKTDVSSTLKPKTSAMPEKSNKSNIHKGKNLSEESQKKKLAADDVRKTKFKMTSAKETRKIETRRFSDSIVKSLKKCPSITKGENSSKNLEKPKTFSGKKCVLEGSISKNKINKIASKLERRKSMDLVLNPEISLKPTTRKQSLVANTSVVQSDINTVAWKSETVPVDDSNAESKTFKTACTIDKSCAKQIILPIKSKSAEDSSKQSKTFTLRSQGGSTLEADVKLKTDSMKGKTPMSIINGKPQICIDLPDKLRTDKMIEETESAESITDGLEDHTTFGKKPFSKTFERLESLENVPKVLKTDSDKKVSQRLIKPTSKLIKKKVLKSKVCLRNKTLTKKLLKNEPDETKNCQPAPSKVVTGLNGVDKKFLEISKKVGIRKKSLTLPEIPGAVLNQNTPKSVEICTLKSYDDLFNEMAANFSSCLPMPSIPTSDEINFTLELDKSAKDFNGKKLFSFEPVLDFKILDSSVTIDGTSKDLAPNKSFASSDEKLVERSEGHLDPKKNCNFKLQNSKRIISDTTKPCELVEITVPKVKGDGKKNEKSENFKTSQVRRQKSNPENSVIQETIKQPKTVVKESKKESDKSENSKKAQARSTESKLESNDSQETIKEPKTVAKESKKESGKTEKHEIAHVGKQKSNLKSCGRQEMIKPPKTVEKESKKESGNPEIEQVQSQKSNPKISGSQETIKQPKFDLKESKRESDKSENPKSPLVRSQRLNPESCSNQETIQQPKLITKESKKESDRSEIALAPKIAQVLGQRSNPESSESQEIIQQQKAIVEESKKESKHTVTTLASNSQASRVASNQPYLLSLSKGKTLNYPVRMKDNECNIISHPKNKEGINLIETRTKNKDKTTDKISPSSKVKLRSRNNSAEAGISETVPSRSPVVGTKSGESSVPHNAVVLNSSQSKAAYDSVSPSSKTKLFLPEKKLNEMSSPLSDSCKLLNQNLKICIVDVIKGSLKKSPKPSPSINVSSVQKSSLPSSGSNSNEQVAIVSSPPTKTSHTNQVSWSNLPEVVISIPKIPMEKNAWIAKHTNSLESMKNEVLQFPETKSPNRQLMKASKQNISRVGKNRKGNSSSIDLPASSPQKSPSSPDTKQKSKSDKVYDFDSESVAKQKSETGRVHNFDSGTVAKPKSESDKVYNFDNATVAKQKSKSDIVYNFDSETVAKQKSESDKVYNFDNATVAKQKSKSDKVYNFDNGTVAKPKSESDKVYNFDNVTVAKQKSKSDKMYDFDSETVAEQKSETDRVYNFENGTVAKPKSESDKVYNFDNVTVAKQKSKSDKVYNFGSETVAKQKSETDRVHNFDNGTVAKPKSESDKVYNFDNVTVAKQKSKSDKVYDFDNETVASKESYKDFVKTVKKGENQKTSPARLPSNPDLETSETEKLLTVNPVKTHLILPVNVQQMFAKTYARGSKKVYDTLSKNTPGSLNNFAPKTSSLNGYTSVTRPVGHLNSPSKDLTSPIKRAAAKTDESVPSCVKPLESLVKSKSDPESKISMNNSASSNIKNASVTLRKSSDLSNGDLCPNITNCEKSPTLSNIKSMDHSKMNSNNYSKSTPLHQKIPNNTCNPVSPNVDPINGQKLMGTPGNHNITCNAISVSDQSVMKPNSVTKSLPAKVNVFRQDKSFKNLHGGKQAENGSSSANSIKNKTVCPRELSEQLSNGTDPELNQKSGSKTAQVVHKKEKDITKSQMNALVSERTRKLIFESASENIKVAVDSGLATKSSQHKRTFSEDDLPMASKKPKASCSELGNKVLAREESSLGAPPKNCVVKHSPETSRGSQQTSAVQVSLGKEAVIECSTQADLEDEDESSGQLFYIPLQQPASTSSQIQGVTLKVDTEGPDKRVIMRAKLVTKPPSKFSKQTASVAPGTLSNPIMPVQAIAPEKRKFRPLGASSVDKSAPVGTVLPTSRSTIPDKSPVVIEQKSANLLFDSSISALKAAESVGTRSTKKLEPQSTATSSMKKTPATPAATKLKSDSRSMKSDKTEIKSKAEKSVESTLTQTKSGTKSKSGFMSATCSKKSNFLSIPSSSASVTKSAKRTKQESGQTESVSKPGSAGKILEAPCFYPTEEELQDPLKYIEKIMPKAEKFGICRIIPPSNFKPDCKVADDMRFTANNQYIHRMLNRWGASSKEYAAIRKQLAAENIPLKNPPCIGGIELDLPLLYQKVQSFGGLAKVVKCDQWQKISEALKIPKSVHDRSTKLYDIYCKYVLPYDNLSEDERKKLFASIEKNWKQHKFGESEFFNDIDKCIVKGSTMALSQFYRVAKNMMTLYFGGAAAEKETGPDPKEVEEEYWKHVSDGETHVCVYAASIDSGPRGFGFPPASSKNCAFSKHPCNLKVLTNNDHSVLRSLGPITDLTVPTLHVGMLFSTFCWFRDPHGLPWIEYLHTGANKIWYGIPSESNSEFRRALFRSLPCNKRSDQAVWLPSDTTMVPPDVLLENGVSLCRTIQQPGQFIVVFPRSFTASISTGYLLSESVFFALPSWLNFAAEIFEDLKKSCEPSVFSFEQLLSCIVTDPRSSMDLLIQVAPLVNELRDREVALRSQLEDLGLSNRERLKTNSKHLEGEEESVYECETCCSNLYFSHVFNSHNEEIYCLSHAAEILLKKKQPLKYFKLLYLYSEKELEDLVKKLNSRLDLKNAKKSTKK